MAVFAERLAEVQRRMRASGAGALIVGPGDNLRYLTGWSEDGHERFLALVLPASGEPALVVPVMNAAQSRGNPAGISHVIGWADDEGWQPAVMTLLARYMSAGAALAVNEELQSVHLLGLQQAFPGSPCRTSCQLIGPLRAVKSAEEVALLRRSAAAADAVYRDTLPALGRGVSETEVQERIAALFRAHGAEEHFALVCFGANAALPHHRSGSARLAEGDIVVLDIGCRLAGYWSDITRTVAFVRPPEGAEQDYRLVREAHMAARQAARPGIPCERVDAAARGVIERAGCGPLFLHRTGHGIGISCHEEPYIVRGNDERLAPGMAFSDEPGVYREGQYGVRIESILVVTDDGAEDLNAPAPDELERVGA